MIMRAPAKAANEDSKPSLVEACKKLSVKQPSIFRVPEHLRKLNENAYTPCHVSIGPIHPTDDKYSVMEEHKLVYTRDLILRRRQWGNAANQDEINKNLEAPKAMEDINEKEINAYIEVVENLEDDARKCYAETIKLTKETFTNMLLIDGCFIVEFLCRKIRKLSYLEMESTDKGGTAKTGTFSRVPAFFKMALSKSEASKAGDSTKTGETTKARGTFKGMYDFIEKVYNDWEPADDFIFQSTRTSFEVRRDLTLLENQLPYFILKKLFEFTFSSAIEEFCSTDRPKFHEIVYCALRTSIPNTTHVLTREDVNLRIRNPEMTAHFVSFLRMCCGRLQNISDQAKAPNGSQKVEQRGSYTAKGQDIKASEGSTSDINNEKISCSQVNTNEQADQGNIYLQSEESTSSQAKQERRINVKHTGEFPCLCNMETPHDIRVPSVTRLAKAGVLFEKTCSKTPLLEIEFDSKRGVLKMPPLTMWHHTETFFRNVMAHELYNHTANSGSRSVSDYMCFMDDLINSKEDVALLVKSKIIHNWLESDEVVADLFNSITKHILADYSSYSDTCKQLNKYLEKYNLRWLKAILQQEYFSQPWAIVYFITLVVIQTAASTIQAVTTFTTKK